MNKKAREIEKTDIDEWAKKMASYLHRAATTIYPCCIPALGGSIGAGRIRLAAANVGV